MRNVKTAGGIVMQDNTILLIKKNGQFALAKGHIEDGETEKTAAVREVLEETGYSAEIAAMIGSFSRPSTEDSGEVVDKDVTIFLMKIRRQEQVKSDQEPVWISVDEAINNMLFPQEKQFLLDHRDTLQN